METAQVLIRTKWSLDHSHSQIGFKVKHLMVTNVRGLFQTYDGSVYTTGENFSSAKIDISISSDSISTGDVARDGHLRSPDFFDTENFKEINFRSSTFERISGNEYAMYGDLSIKGITKRIKLDVKFNGIVKDPYGTKRAGFEVTGKISRKHFGLAWNTALETGGVLVGDEVIINCEIQLIQKPEQ